MNKENKSYHKLLVWQKLILLLKVTYKLVDKLPRSEDFVLKSQMKRAIVSVISNFVEGYLKRSKKEKLHFLEVAETSLLELEGQAEICYALDFWTKSDYEKFEKSRGLAAYFLRQYCTKISS